MHVLWTLKGYSFHSDIHHRIEFASKDQITNLYTLFDAMLIYHSQTLYTILAFFTTHGITEHIVSTIQSLKRPTTLSSCLQGVNSIKKTASVYNWIWQDLSGRLERTARNHSKSQIQSH